MLSGPLPSGSGSKAITNLPSDVVEQLDLYSKVTLFSRYFEKEVANVLSHGKHADTPGLTGIP